MNFLNTGLLFGLALAAIPLLLHLLARRRLKTRPFPTLDFLRRLQIRQLRNLRLKQWLLLALRTLVLLLLALAFLRPTISGSSAGVDENETVVLLDLSASMAAKDGGASALEKAREMIKGIWSAGGRVGLVVASSGPERDHPQAAVGGEPPEWIDLLSVDGRSEDPAKGMARALERLEESKAAIREIIWISDFNGSVGNGLPELPEGVNLLRLDAGAHEEIYNLAVTSVELTDALPRAGMSTELKLTLSLSGAESDTVLVGVLVDGRRVMEGALELRNGQGTQHVLPLRLPAAGVYRLEVEIEAEDGFSLDNRLAGVLDVPENPGVLLTGDNISALRYLQLALNPGEGITGGDVVVKSGALAEEDLKGIDVVILAGPGSVNDHAAESLVKFVNRGGGLWVFPSTSMDPGTVSRTLLSRLNVGAIVDDIRYTEQSWGDMDRGHPALAGLLDKGSRFDSPRVFRQLLLSGSRPERTVVRLENDTPFLSEFSLGEGRVWWTPVSIDLEWTDWPLTGAFTTVVTSGVRYLAGSVLKTQVYRCGEPIRWPDLPETRGRAVETVDPFGEYLPTARSEEVGVAWVTEATRIPGHYRLFADGQEVALAAVQIDPGESRFEDMAPSSFPGVLLEYEADETLANELRERRTGHEFSSTLLFLALTLLVTESLLSRQKRNS